jgi:hypothetical protein
MSKERDRVAELTRQLLEDPAIRACVVVVAFEDNLDIQAQAASIGRHHEIRGLLAVAETSYRVRGIRAMGQEEGRG